MKPHPLFSSQSVTDRLLAKYRLEIERVIQGGSTLDTNAARDEIRRLLKQFNYGGAK